MLADIKNLLNQELILYRAATDNELEKRRHILSAHSRNLSAATEKTEALLEEIHKLAAQRMDCIAEHLAEIGSSLDPIEVNLSMIVEFAEAENIGSDYRALMEAYQSQVLTLKRETQENGRLLEQSAGALNRLLGSLKDLADPQQSTYAPVATDSRGERKQSGSVLVNANA